jgi:hypothetical protein
VLIQAFDRYGIDRVEVSHNGAGFVALADPTRYRFVATSNDPQVIEARAWDPNGNVSPVARVTLQPYTGDGGEPQLALLAPANGSVYHEGEPVTLEVMMRNLSEAQLHFDIVGDESDPRNPAPVTVSRGANDPERFAYAARLPLTGEDAVVVVRLTAGELAARRYLNVLADDGIEQDADLTVLPASTMLGGTELWVDAKAPKDMNDFSDESSVSVNDPDDGAAVASFAMDAGPRAVAIGNQGAGVKVSAVLRDRSGHEKAEERLLAKLPYLGAVEATVQAPNVGVEAIGQMQAGPGGLLWVINASAGGYRIESLTGTVAAETSGRIERMVFSGTGLVAWKTRDGQGELLYWPLGSGGTFGEPLRTSLSGELIGASGELIYLRHGALFDGYHVAGNELLPVAGQVINEPVRIARVDHQRLFVLTETGLYAFVAGGGDWPQLEREFYVALPGYGDFHVDGNRLVSWADSTATLFEIDEAGALAEVGRLDAQGTIRGAMADGELLWLHADGPYADSTWQAWRGAELVGLLRDGIEDMVFDGDVLYTLRDGAIERRALAAAAGVAPLEPTLSETPLGVLVSNVADSGALGGERVRFTDDTGAVLPTQRLWLQGRPQWFVPRSVLGGRRGADAGGGHLYPSDGHGAPGR